MHRTKTSTSSNALKANDKIWLYILVNKDFADSTKARNSNLTFIEESKGSKTMAGLCFGTMTELIACKFSKEELRNKASKHSTSA